MDYTCEECGNCDQTPKANAEECSGKGTLMCGGCNCNDGHKGNTHFISKNVVYMFI